MSGSRRHVPDSGRGFGPHGGGPSAAPLLEVENVPLRCKTASLILTATDGPSSTNRSDRFVLLGPSGCGKSTLLKALGGDMQPSEGEIRIKDRTVKAPGADRMMVFQEFDQLLPWATVLENITFPLPDARGLSRREAVDKACYHIEKVGLSRAIDSYRRNVSGGISSRDRPDARHAN